MVPSVTALVSLLFFISGISGLIYEVVWAKQLILVLGNTALAHTLVLCVFMGGLSLGNALLGRQADKTPNPLRLYALLEAAIALFGALSPSLLAILSESYIAWARQGVPPSLAFGLKVLLCVLTLLAPATLMGGTLPILSRFAARSLRETEGAISRLYFFNSLGASTGALLAGFWLVAAFGLNLPVYIAAALNFGIGACAFFMARDLDFSPDSAEAALPVRKKFAPSAAQLRVLHGAVFVAGFVALAYEVAWIRLLALALGSSAYSFSLMLAAFIGGIAFGSLLVRRLALARLDSFSFFGLTQAGLAFSILITFPLYGRIPYFLYVAAGMLQRTPATFYVYEAVHLLLCFILMLLPTAFMGMALPLAASAAARSEARLGEEVGRVFSLNALGNVLGALAAGLWLLPALGIEGVIAAGVALNLLTAGLVAKFAGASRRTFIVGGLCLAGVLALAVPGQRLNKLVLSGGEFRARPSYQPFSYREYRDRFKDQTLLYYKDDSDATITVLRESGEVFLKTNGKTDASLWADRNTEVLSAHIPLLLTPRAEDVLVVGLGSGKTAGSALLHPIQRLDLVEISRAVVEANKFFNEHNHRPLEDPRLILHLDDAKTYMRLNPRRYDVIISEPSNPWIAGIGNLFSTDFYRQSRQSLKPGGVMVQWFHLYEMTDETFALILRTFCSQFGNVLLWEMIPSKGDVLLIGSEKPLSADFAWAENEMKRPEVSEELSQLGIKALPTILSLQTAADATARTLAASGRINEDQFPLLEYEAPKALFLRALSEALYSKDQRQSHRGREPLLMSRYLKERRRPLSAEEFANLADFHGQSHGILQVPLLYEWIRRFPADERPRWDLSQVKMESGDAEGALALVEGLLRQKPNAPAYLERAAGLSLDQFLGHRSYLTEGLPERSLRYWERLAAAAKGEKRTQAYQRIAEIYANTGSLDDAERSIAKAAQGASAPDALWVIGARMAFDRGNPGLAASCLDKALKLNAANREALALRARLP